MPVAVGVIYYQQYRIWQVHDYINQNAEFAMRFRVFKVCPNGGYGDISPISEYMDNIDNLNFSSLGNDINTFSENTFIVINLLIL